MEKERLPRVDGGSVPPDLVVEVRAGGAPRASQQRDRRPALHVPPALDEELGEVRVDRGQAVFVAERQHEPARRVGKMIYSFLR